MKNCTINIIGGDVGVAFKQVFFVKYKNVSKVFFTKNTFGVKMYFIKNTYKNLALPFNRRKAMPSYIYLEWFRAKFYFYSAITKK